MQIASRLGLMEEDGFAFSAAKAGCGENSPPLFSYSAPIESIYKKITSIRKKQIDVIWWRKMDSNHRS